MREIARSQGAEKLRNWLTTEQKPEVGQKLQSYFELILFWRNFAAHASPRRLDEEEAFTSLLTLLRFVHFADSRWNEISTPISASNT